MLTFFNTAWVIKLQYLDRHPSFGSNRDNLNLIELKMFRPFLSSGIVEESQNSCRRIKRTDITPFKAITVRTGQSQILGDSFTPVLFGDNVFHFKG